MLFRSFDEAGAHSMALALVVCSLLALIVVFTADLKALRRQRGMSVNPLPSEPPEPREARV